MARIESARSMAAIIEEADPTFESRIWAKFWSFRDPGGVWAEEEGKSAPYKLAHRGALACTDGA
jgi:hypothetical protein